jgi:hypothetical protein
MASRRPQQSSDTPVSLAGGAPPESNRRPHPYHSCCRTPLEEAAEVKRSGVSAADRGEPEASYSERHGDGTAGEDDCASHLTAEAPVRPMLADRPAGRSHEQR